MLELMMEIEANYSCLKPVRQLVSVAHVHPSASAIYLPPSVLLRRCSDQTGCCTNERLSCQPAANATVKQPVLVSSARRRSGTRARRPGQDAHQEPWKCIYSLPSGILCRCLPYFQCFFFLTLGYIAQSKPRTKNQNWGPLTKVTSRSAAD